MGSGAGSSYDMTRGNPWEPKKVAANFATMGGASVWSRSHDETTGKVVDAINSPAVLARKQAEEAARMQKEQFDKQNADLEAQQAKEAADADQSNANSAQQMARKRQKALAAGAGGRSSTILTSPLGVIDQAATSKKTLLGA